MTQVNVAALVLAFAASSGAVAQPAEGRSEIPTAGASDTRAEVTSALPQSRLIGKTRLSVWGFQVYDARLWALADFKADKIAAQPFVLELTYLRSFDNQNIAARSIAEMRRSAPVSEPQAKAWTEQMMRVIPDVKAGDRITGIHRPGVGARFLVNGKTSGEIADVEFATLFFGIWLSPKTSAPKMRLELLAGTP